jgi:CheY-like chemotaxis protein
MKNVGAKPKILIVEPREATAIALSELLLERGIEADFVTSSEGAMTVLATTEYGIILLNVSESSLALAQRIRQDLGLYPEIILMSGEQEAAIKECHQIGCCAVAPSPLDTEALCDLVERISGYSGKRRYDGAQLHIKSFEKAYGEVSSENGKTEIRLASANVGRGGFAYEVAADASTPQVGELISFEVCLPMLAGHSFRGQGVVRWVHKEGAMTAIGVEFVSIPRETESLIQDFADLFRVLPYVPLPETAPTS